MYLVYNFVFYTLVNFAHMSSANFFDTKGNFVKQ